MGFDNSERSLHVQIRNDTRPQAIAWGARLTTARRSSRERCVQKLLFKMLSSPPFLKLRDIGVVVNEC